MKIAMAMVMMLAMVIAMVMMLAMVLAMVMMLAMVMAQMFLTLAFHTLSDFFRPQGQKSRLR